MTHCPFRQVWWRRWDWTGWAAAVCVRVHVRPGAVVLQGVARARSLARLPAASPCRRRRPQVWTGGNPSLSAPRLFRALQCALDKLELRTVCCCWGGGWGRGLGWAGLRCARGWLNARAQPCNPASIAAMVPNARALCVYGCRLLVRRRQSCGGWLRRQGAPASPLPLQGCVTHSCWPRACTESDHPSRSWSTRSVCGSVQYCSWSTKQHLSSPESRLLCPQRVSDEPVAVL